MSKADEVFIGAIDQGTSSSRFLIFNVKGQIVASHQAEYENHYAKAGWVEKDPNQILQSVETVIVGACRRFNALGYETSQIKGVGITNQRETTIAFDIETGEPLTNAIIWNDVRTKELVHKLIAEAGSATRYATISGLPITTYFSAVKMRWMLENIPAVQAAREKGTLRFGTVDAWLIYKMTGSFVTDVTNASRTMLMDIKTFKWSKECLDFFGVQESELPEIRSSSEIYGTINTGRLEGLPIAGCLGDQQAAMVGQSCFETGEAKNTYGTGCFMLFNTGETPIFSKNGLLTTVGYKLGANATPKYALEGSVAVAGSAIQWLRDKVGLIVSAPEIGFLADTVKDNGGVYFVTAFSGLFAPYWRDDARGCIVGLTQYATRGHIARATLESVCYQSHAILDAMRKDSGHELRRLRVDGGMTNSEQAMQIQADILGIEVVRPEMRETTALGAALAAGLGVGVWKDESELRQVAQSNVTAFWSGITSEKRTEMIEGWEKAVKRSLDWA
ncbi:Glycerol kinase [Coemansia sp. RSA 1813]|nr:Glycerol kinase [Coemansia sp. RSA 1646]KAJ1764723.1 Glycerol kinase [Coemansia sp. RSA 1843]KAJ2085017.1 Glycerol kinase [Coemansia sp. RSA 986]KAJ2212502.1 Glycerol kinase [Coemansia sp. RSA 487]KAJ2561525.1 Glycerol kinase [Coemansia sp. RSA 1813]